MEVHEYQKPEFRPFQIVVRIDGVPRRLSAVLILQSIGEERYKISARNKVLVFSTNRPIVDRRGLKDFPWTWKLVEGQLHNMYARELITKTLEAYLRGKMMPRGGSLRA